LDKVGKLSEIAGDIKATSSAGGHSITQLSLVNTAYPSWHPYGASTQNRFFK